MIPAFLLSPIGRKIALGLGAVCLVGIFAGVIYQRGKSAGYGDGQRAQIEDDRKQMTQERDQFAATIKAAQDKIAAADADRAAADARAAVFSRAIAVTSQQRQDAQRQLNAIPDSQVFGHIVGELGMRAAGDNSQTFSIPELRKIDSEVTDYPKLSKQYEQLAGQQKANDDAIKALDAKVDGITKQRDAAMLWGNQLMEHYVKAYNAAQKKPGLLMKIVTFGLAKGKHIDIPDPVTLTPPEAK